MQFNIDDDVALLLLFFNVKGKAVPVERSEECGSTGTHVFLQTVVNHQSTKLKSQVNGIEVEDVLDTEANVTIISHKPWIL